MLVETVAQSTLGAGVCFQSLASSATVCKLSDTDVVDVPRSSNDVDEFDRVLGGGLISGDMILVGSDPGIGKSTLLLQTSSNPSANRRVPYVSGEESGSQITLRARRPGVENSNLALLAEVQLEHIWATIETEKPEVAIIDSTQTLCSRALTSAPGSMVQVRECTAQLTRIAKWLDVTTILAGHVTKGGALAGSRVLKYIVDTALYFEGDTHSAYRLVQAFRNRFSAVNELGVFTMTECGPRGVANPSTLFLLQREQVVPGSYVLVTQEGTRPLLVEVQALVDTVNVSSPRRLAAGPEQNRSAMLLAVLYCHAGTVCFDQNVLLDAVGDMKVTEPAADLAVLLVIYSPMCNKALPRELVVFGEIGLAGEIYPVPRGQERLKGAVELDSPIAMIPESSAPRQAISGLEVIAAERIEQAAGRVRSFGA